MNSAKAHGLVNLGSLEEARSCLAHGIYNQRTIEKEISRFATGFRYQQTAVARCTMERSVIISSDWVVICAYWITRAKALPFQGGLEHSDEPPCDFDETAQRALIACCGGVDQDPTLNPLPGNTREYVETLSPATSHTILGQYTEGDQAMIFHDAQLRRFQKYRPVPNDENDDGILKNGEFIRVPMEAMDTDQRQYTFDTSVGRGQLYDARGQPAGSRPGYLFSDNNDARAAAEAAWRARGERLRDAWKNRGPIREGQ